MARITEQTALDYVLDMMTVKWGCRGVTATVKGTVHNDGVEIVEIAATSESLAYPWGVWMESDGTIYGEC